MRRMLLTAAIASSLAALGWAADPPPATPPAKAYPFDTCIVTGEKLDAMGGAHTVIKDGQEVKFCCKGCVRAFDKDPAKFMKKISEAPAAGAPAPAAPATGHEGHKH